MPFFNRSMQRLLPIAAILCGLLGVGAQAQDRPAPLDVLNLDAVVTSDVTPDLAVMTLSVQREGTDSAALSQDVNQVIAHALADAKQTPGVLASTGGYSASARFDSKGQRNGWQVQAELKLRSRDFGVLGKLAAKLTGTPGAVLQISNSGFEVSPELKSSEEGALIERGAAAFRNKASAAAKAFGYSGYGIREVSLGQAVQSGSSGPRAPRVMSFSESAAPVPLDSGHVTLQLNVSGSIQMHH